MGVRELRPRTDRHCRPQFNCLVAAGGAKWNYTTQVTGYGAFVLVMSSVTAAGDAGTTHARWTCLPPSTAASAVVPAQLRSLRSSPHTHTHTHSSGQPWIERDAKRAARLMIPVTCLVTLRSPLPRFFDYWKATSTLELRVGPISTVDLHPRRKIFFQLVCPPPPASSVAHAAADAKHGAAWPIKLFRWQKLWLIRHWIWNTVPPGEFEGKHLLLFVHSDGAWKDVFTHTSICRGRCFALPVTSLRNNVGSCGKTKRERWTSGTILFVAMLAVVLRMTVLN